MRSILLVLILLLSSSATSAPDGGKLRCMDAETRDRLRGLILAALDKGMQMHFENLFDVWMKDGDRGQPMRIANGLRIGVNAYTVSRGYLQNWSPELCEESVR